MTAPDTDTLAPPEAGSRAIRRGQKVQHSGLRPGLLLLCGAAAVLGAVGFVSARVELNGSHGAEAASKQSSTAAPGASSQARALLSQLTRRSEPSTPDLLTVELDDRTPESQLIQSYQQLARGEEAKAFETVERLLKRQPDFALAQLLYGDLLLARAKPVDPKGVDSSEGAASAATAQGSTNPDPVAGLRAEAKLRLAALIERPPQDALPKALIGLSPAIRHALVVDTSRARIYLFENSAEGLRLVRDSYVSIGKQGIGKLVEGDLRTPLGAYHVGLRRDEAAERYGAAALPLNYPNEYDRMAGRGGSSIWLHGERIGNYARGPLTTDGCIVLSNDEMAALADTVVPRETPVLVYEKVEWVKKDKAASPVPAAFESAYQQWHSARMAQDASTLRKLYEPGLERGSDSEAERLAYNLARMERRQLPLQSLERLSVLPWQDKEPVVIVTYRESTPQDSKPKLKRQYWREHQGQWRILFDGVVG